MGTLADFASSAGYCITIITLITMIIKPIRSRLVDALVSHRKNTEQDKKLAELLELVQGIQNQLAIQSTDVDALKEALQCSIRNTITHLYYKYIERGEIPKLEKENLAALYEVYIEDLNGNSYVHSCYEQLMELPTTKE